METESIPPKVDPIDPDLLSRLPEGFEVYSPRNDKKFDIKKLIFSDLFYEGRRSKLYYGIYSGFEVVIRVQQIVDSKINGTDDSANDYLASELSIFKNVNHPNLVRFYGASVCHNTPQGGDAAIFIVMEKMSAGGGDLRTINQVRR
jgi:hypothetical protein